MISYRTKKTSKELKPNPNKINAVYPRQYVHQFHLFFPLPFISPIEAAGQSKGDGGLGTEATHTLGRERGGGY